MLKPGQEQQQAGQVAAAGSSAGSIALLHMQRALTGAYCFSCATTLGVWCTAERS